MLNFNQYSEKLKMAASQIVVTESTLLEVVEICSFIRGYHAYANHAVKSSDR